MNTRTTPPAPPPPAPDRIEAAFYESWKHAVELAKAPELFGSGGPRKDNYAPKFYEIKRRFPSLPKSRAAWVAVLVQFYNPEEGAKLAHKAGCNGLGDISLLIDQEQKRTLYNLMTTFRGW